MSQRRWTREKVVEFREMAWAGKGVDYKEYWGPLEIRLFECHYVFVFNYVSLTVEDTK